jgi:hypothetical protein
MNDRIYPRWAVIAIVGLVAGCGKGTRDPTPVTATSAANSTPTTLPKDARTLCIEKIRAESCPAGTSLDCSESVIDSCKKLAEGALVHKPQGPVGCFSLESVTYGCKPNPNMCGPNNVRVRRITREVIDCSPCGGNGQDCCDGPDPMCAQGLECNAGTCRELRTCAEERRETYGSTDAHRGGGTIRVEVACLPPRPVLSGCRREEFGMNGGQVDAARTQGNTCICTGSFPGQSTFGPGHSAGCRVYATCCNR